MSLGMWKNASPMQRRIITIIIVFIAAVAVTAVATLTPMTQQDATSTNNDVRQEVQTLQANNVLLFYIFGNNFFITMISFVPFIGPIIGFIIFYNTGVVLEAEAMAQNVPPGLYLFALFLTPIAWLEFAAYSTAIAGSFWLSARMLQGGFRHEIQNTAKFMAICAVLLLIGAVIETALIYAGY